MKTLNSIFMDIAATALTAEDQRLLAHPLVGGVVLFTRNFKSYAQLQVLVKDIRAVKPEIIIAVDHEGGRVQRFKQGFTRIPPMATLGRLYHDNPHFAKEAAFAIAYLLAIELGDVGIDLNVGPVLDLDYQKNSAIGNRALHANPRVVAALGLAYMQGLKAAGMTAVAKHFPGHGYVAWDSHVSLPVDDRDAQTIYQQDLLPFQVLIQQGLAAIMPSHIIYKAVDPAITNFSEKWLKKILRKQLGFGGLVLSDDMHMQATHHSGNMVARAFKALQAGCDAVLICNDRHGLISTLTSLPQLSVLNTTPLRLKPHRHPNHEHVLATAKQWIRVLGV